ncbi:MAG: ABC transporter permease [Oscillospiraceae bacterium]|nr:ABC transporter permease [Oscillospiraceae bacterium]
MKILVEIGLLFKRKLLEELRSPMWLFMGLTTPLLYLALFAPLLSGLSGENNINIADTFVPGMLALFALGTGTGVGWVIISELKSGVIERFRVTPVSRFSLLMGNVLKDVVAFIIPSLVVIIVSHFLAGFDIKFGGLAVLMLLLAVLTAVISAVSGSCGLILKEVGTLAAVITGLQLPITLLAGVLLPIDIGPAWLKILAHINPLYYVVDASRVLAAGTILDSKVYLAFGVMIPLLVLTLWWATRVYKKAIA